MSTLHQQATDRLGEEICRGHFRPGDILPAEPMLGEHLGVSRIVVREAIKSLASKGMLAVRRKTGTQVLDASHWSLFDTDIIAWRARTATLDAPMLKELMELRRIVEPAACRFAAERSTDEEREQLRDALEAMRRAVAGGGDYVSADLRFHTLILDACRNQFVRRMQSALAAILKTSFDLIATVPGGPARSLPLHEALCAAIEGGRPDEAESAAQSIIAQAETDLHERLTAR